MQGSGSPIPSWFEYVFIILDHPFLSFLIFASVVALIFKLSRRNRK